MSNISEPLDKQFKLKTKKQKKNLRIFKGNCFPIKNQIKCEIWSLKLKLGSWTDILQI